MPNEDEFFGQPFEARWQAIMAWLVRYYKWHLSVFIVLNVLLTIANIVSGPPWWGLWPLVITGAAFTLHYLIYKTATVNDRWVEERAADLFDKSYDQGHIESIAGRHELETPLGRWQREAHEQSEQDLKRSRGVPEERKEGARPGVEEERKADAEKPSDHSQP